MLIKRQDKPLKTRDYMTATCFIPDCNRFAPRSGDCCILHDYLNYLHEKRNSREERGDAAGADYYLRKAEEYAAAHDL